MKKPRPIHRIGRKRRTLGWTLITLGVLIAALWAASGWWAVAYQSSTWNIEIWRGCAQYRWHLDPSRTPNIWYADYQMVAGGLSRFAWWIGFEHRVDGAFQITVDEFGVGRAFRTLGGGYVALLLWPFPLLLCGAGIPLLRSGILARRRAMIGKCKSCGYDLAGLGVDPTCPECGKGGKATTIA